MKISEVVETYVKLRDKKSELKADYDAKKLKIDEALTQIENKLLEAFNNTGMESVKTAMGTAYVSEQTSATVADREAFMKHVLENDGMGLLEVRCSKTAVAQYMEETQELPPGVNWRSERVINVRRT